ncbi:sugar dehydrogenase complex small subunit [Paracoccus sp. R86501]|uniref:sugar dehydrogenase complex small subunit n=1 Tax=Paracoccus sp. R86501 TaxID=3101711 RepID=UPI00366EE9BA
MFENARLDRRQFLGSSAMGLFVAALPSAGFAQDAIRIDRFMALSRFATGHQHLDSDLGAGLLQGLRLENGDFDADAQALERKISETRAPDVETLLTALNRDPLRETLLAIISAWYTGAVAKGSDATVYTFEKALMYQPALDAVPIPTYALNGPDWWTATPPALLDMPAF